MVEKIEFCTVKPFSIYCIILIMITVINVINLKPEYIYFSDYLGYKCILLAAFPIIMLFTSYLTLTYALLFVTIFACINGPLNIIIHQMFIFTFLVLAYQFIAILIFFLFTSKYIDLANEFIKQGLRIIRKRAGLLLCVYFTIHIAICGHTFFILYFPDFLVLNEIQKYAMILLNFFCLYFNYKIAINLFSYISSDIILSAIFNRQVMFKDQILYTVSNVVDNFSAVNCLVFHIQSFKSVDDFMHTLMSISYMFSGIGINNSQIIFEYRNLYNIQLMALYKICKCNQKHFSKFNRDDYVTKQYTDPTWILYNIKWICIGIAGWYFQIFRVTDYIPSNFILDKEFQSRLYIFYCAMLSISMCFELYDIAWKSLVVAYAQDSNDILNYNLDVYTFLSRNTPI